MAHLSEMIGSVPYGALRAIRNAGMAGIFAISGAAAVAEPVTVAALGDSLTQGYGLAPEDGLVPQLQAWLEAQGADVVVINAGVSGDTTAGGLARVDWTLTEEVKALIVTLGGNDFLRGIAPEVSRANLEGILEVAEAKDVQVLLIGMQAPGNYGQDYKTAFDAMYPELSEAYGTVYLPSFFAGFDVGEDIAAARDLMQPDGIHPNADGVALIVEGIGPSVLELIAEAN